MTNQQYQKGFAVLVEVVARGIEFNDQCNDLFEALLTNIVTEAGGNVDDEDFVYECNQMLCDTINKNADERRAYLQTQAA